MNAMKDDGGNRPRVGLFVTCLVDLFRPAVGFAALKLIEEAGCRVEVPMAQTCCGQPDYSSGDRTEARAAAEQTIRIFGDFDYVVAPSGSCAGMLKKHYPRLFQGDAQWEGRAAAFSAKVHELVSFLVDVRGMSAVSARREETVTYHDCCSGLRELGIRRQPRALLASIKGLDLVEMQDSDLCCGFRGALRPQDPGILKAMAKAKALKIDASGARMVLADDLGCLISMAGTMKRAGSGVQARHIAEVLAGMDDGPPIGGTG